VTPLASTTSGTSGSGNVDGFVGGGQIGYNWKRDQWLFGLEADIQYSDQKGSYTACNVAGCLAGSALGTADHRLKWFGTFRGRAGWLPTNWLLLYATGGLVYGQLESNYLSGIVGTTLLAGSNSTTRAGWTVGGGAEGRINNEWSVKVEYLYADYGNFDTTLGTGAAVVTTGPCAPTGTGLACTRTTTTSTVASAVSTNFIDHIIRVGLNYRFGGPRL
jgi:outer membrane immunogenic protein